MTRFQRATLDPFDRCWMFPWRGSVHGPPTRLCRPLFKMAEVARVQGREVLSMIFFFFFFFFRNLSIFEFWRGFRWRWKYSKKDEFEDETIGELPSPGILEKFFPMEIRWFPFFSLTLKFRENSKSHRVVEMLQDIWRLLSPENENGREMTMKVVAINGGFYLMESVFQEEYFSLEYLHLLNDLINVAQIGFLTIGGGITWQKKKKMRKTKAHEIEEILSF